MKDHHHTMAAGFFGLLVALFTKLVTGYLAYQPQVNGFLQTLLFLGSLWMLWIGYKRGRQP